MIYRHWVPRCQSVRFGKTHIPNDMRLDLFKWIRDLDLGWPETKITKLVPCAAVQPTRPTWCDTVQPSQLAWCAAAQSAHPAWCDAVQPTSSVPCVAVQSTQLTWCDTSYLPGVVCCDTVNLSVAAAPRCLRDFLLRWFFGSYIGRKVDSYHDTSTNTTLLIPAAFDGDGARSSRPGLPSH